MGYCFVNFRRSKEDKGWEPDFPEGTSFALLADLRISNWGLYEYQLSRDNENWVPSNPVSDELEALIWSGKRYPPALAIAREEMVRLFNTKQPCQQEFAEAYANAIRSRLSRQQEAPYFLARALQGDGIDLVPGEWYWLLRIGGIPPMASWVSGDYFVYENPVCDFELTDNQIKRIRFEQIA